MGQPLSKRRAATVAASAAVGAYQLLQKYGPTLLEYLRSNPEMVDQARQFVSRAQGASGGGANAPSITERLELLRTQVDELAAAEDGSEADREFAAAQRAHLAAVEKSMATLPVMAERQRKKNLRRFSRSLDEAAEDIVSHLLGEDVSAPARRRPPLSFRR